MRICFCVSFLSFISLYSSVVFAAECETNSFDLGGAQYYIYSDGRTWDFTASKDMNITNVETVSYIGGPNGNILTIEALINGSVIASWTQSVNTTYSSYIKSQSVTSTVSLGDTITYKISGGTFSTPGGAISGSNSISLCYTPPCQKPSISSFSATPSLIEPEQSTNLSWSILNANSATIDQGIGSVSANTGAFMVSPDKSTTYTLSATNSCGTTMAQTSVNIKNASVLQGPLTLLLTKKASPPSTLGLQCSNTCAGSVCFTTSSTCTDSDLSMNCIGTATGLFCSNSCQDDSDCANTNTSMRCLTSCTNGPNYVNKCWTDSDHTFLSNIVCD